MSKGKRLKPHPWEKLAHSFTHILLLICFSKENTTKMKKQLSLSSHIPRHSCYYFALALQTSRWGSHAKPEDSSHHFLALFVVARELPEGTKEAELRGTGETNLALPVSKKMQCEAWFCDTVGMPSLGLSGNLWIIYYEMKPKNSKPCLLIAPPFTEYKLIHGEKSF